MVTALLSSASVAQSEPIQTRTATTSKSKVDPRIYQSTLGLGLAAGAIKLLHRYPRFGFRGSLLFDDNIRELLRLDEEAARDTASSISDILQAGLLAAPLLETGLLYGRSLIDGQRAWQRTVIDAQAIALSMSILLATKTFVGRLRPKTPTCRGGENDLSCASAPLRMSFVSGHTTAAFTGAGLVCAHPRQGRNSYPLEAWTCPLALGLASTTGLLRVASDNHYLTDVLGGAALGLISGYALPRLWHYTQNDSCTDKDDKECTTSRFPGDAYLYALGSSRFDSIETIPSFGAKLKLQQSYHHRTSRQMGAYAMADGELHQSFSDYQHQELSLHSGIFYEKLGLAWDFTWASKQDGEINRDEFGHGPALRFTQSWGKNKTLQARATWYPWRNRSSALSMELDSSFGKWFGAYLGFKTGGPGLEKSQYQLQFGLSTHLNWNQ